MANLDLPIRKQRYQEGLRLARMRFTFRRPRDEIPVDAREGPTIAMLRRSSDRDSPVFVTHIHAMTLGRG